MKNQLQPDNRGLIQKYHLPALLGEKNNINIIDAEFVDCTNYLSKCYEKYKISLFNNDRHLIDIVV